MRLIWITLIAVSGCALEMPSLPLGSAGPNTCGDGVVQAGEPCDDGNAVETDACLSNCNLNACGDSFVHVGVEECDDGNTIDQDECRNNCEWSVCGDGSIRLGLSPNEAGYEACDDDNTDNNDSCTNQCTEAACGDGYVQVGVEACDDGNLEVGDGCNDQCQMECGNDVLDPNEECDDGNDNDGDGCPASCRRARCGDGYQRTDLGTNHVDAEACDDGNDSNLDACLNDCTLARCGDGFARQDLEFGETGFEECDDGNDDDSDACPSTCEAAKCGDGFERQGLNADDPGYEACDDGNDDNSDDCRNCAEPRCGDGVVDLLTEACDGDPSCDPNTCQPRVTELVFGYNWGCAARAGGSVLCWPPDPPGTDPQNSRAMGDGEPLESTVVVNSVPAVPLANLVANGTAACAISGGEDPALSGKVYCWGERQMQQLGRPIDQGIMRMIDPVAQPVSNSETPELQFSMPVRSVHAAADSNGFCLIDAGRRIFCWGFDEMSFWSNFDFPSRGEGPHLLLPDESGVKSLAIAGSTICFINADDRVLCMGDDSNGKLGRNTIGGDFQTAAAFVQGLPDAAALEIAASHQTVCVRTADQRLSCWGNNQWRQIGRFSRPAQSTAYLQPNLDQVTALAMTFPASCALRLGRLYCWGVPAFGSNLWDESINRPGTLPVHMEGLPEGVQVQTIHGGSTWVCALASNHRSYCWGNANEDGRLFGTDQDVYTTAVELNPWSTPLPEPNQP